MKQNSNSKNIKKNFSTNSSYVYNNIIGNKKHLYKRFGEHFSSLKALDLEISDDFFDNDNLYNIGSNKQNEFTNLNDFNDIRL